MTRPHYLRMAPMPKPSSYRVPAWRRLARRTTPFAIAVVIFIALVIGGAWFYWHYSPISPVIFIKGKPYA